MEDNSRYNDNYTRDFEGKLKYVGKNVTVRTDRILAEFLRGHYPDITSKELTICKTIADTLWDQGEAPYVEILARVKNNLGNPFESPEDIEDTIKVLIEKGIVIFQTKFIQYGDGKKFRPEKVLKLRDNTEAEVVKIICKEFNSFINQAFFDKTR
jgi:tagatose-1,6-bisphosphate aldolase